MLRLLRLFWRIMLRMAARLWLLFFIGAAVHGGLRTWSWTYLLGAGALGCCYVSGASLNDIADESIDRINLPDNKDRPLVAGDATRSELAALAAVSAAVALLGAALLGPVGTGLIAVGLLIGVTYSMSPLRLSRGTFAPPLILGIGYVLLSYGLGAVVAGGSIGERDLVAAALFTLYLGRINLKDFRDRVGDAKYGRRPLLLRFGKRTACIVSGVCLLAGDVLLSSALRPSVLILVLLQLYVGAIAFTLVRLFKATNDRFEQAAIALGARMGDGLLLLVLAYLVMIALDAPGTEIAILCCAIAGASGLTLLASLSAEPKLVVDDLYKEAVLDHYRSPRNKRALSRATVSFSRSNPYCGDEVTVHVQVGDGALQEVAFEGQGCSISQASASMMTEAVKGRAVAVAMQLAESFKRMTAGQTDADQRSLGELVAMKGVVRYPARVKCAVLAWDVLQATLARAAPPAGSALGKVSLADSHRGRV